MARQHEKPANADHDHRNANRHVQDDEGKHDHHAEHGEKDRIHVQWPPVRLSAGESIIRPDSASAAVRNTTIAWTGAQ